jgi:hypothetical protein
MTEQEKRVVDDGGVGHHGLGRAHQGRTKRWRRLNADDVGPFGVGERETQPHPGDALQEENVQTLRPHRGDGRPARGQGSLDSHSLACPDAGPF